MLKAPTIPRFLLLLFVVGLVAGWSGCAKRQEGKEVVLFDRRQAAVILVPAEASEEELRAARLIQDTLAKAARRARHDFAIVREAPAGVPVIALRGRAETTGPKLEDWVASRVELDRVELTAYPADAIEAAAAWWLERTVGARWFMPGTLGEHVPFHAEVRLPFGQSTHRPSYISRDLYLIGPPSNAEWGRRNRLRRWFNHGHAVTNLFTRDDLRANPAFIPLVNGRRWIPAEGDHNWQPNVASEAAAIHAAERLGQRTEFSSAIGMNDSLRHDQSEATRQWVGGPRWFRLRPDFSALEFRFVNEVARRLPKRYLGAYAYYWSEDTPPFPVEKNVIPYLTADRSGWFDPKFEAEDKALMKRWVAAGSEVVGIYDYYYGAPFFVPRPTLYAVSRSIPYADEAGVRAFFAEIASNWALDGPKAWLAMQLLWDAAVDPEELLDTYYREFWREAAGPMREFYEICDEQWLNQPLPAYWLKYYNDEHQHLLFPREARGKLRGLLDRAMAGATTELTRNRLRFVSAGFSVTEAFCQWTETRDRLSRAALAPEVDSKELSRMGKQYELELVRLQTLLAEVKQQYPLAISAELKDVLTRNDPRRRAAWRQEEGAKQGAEIKPAKSEALRAKGEEPGAKSEGRSARGEGAGPELLADTTLTQLEIGSTSGFFDLEWVTRGAWRGHGQPYQTRRVSILRQAQREEQRAKGKEHGSESGGRRADDGGRTTEGGTTPKPSDETLQSDELGSQSLVLRFEGCKQETMSQIVKGEPGKRYVARVKVRARVSPGNMTFLILNFQGPNGEALGMGSIDRLPVGEFNETVELSTWAEAPEKAGRVGIGVIAIHQVGDDFAEFHHFSLQEANAQPSAK